MKYFAISLFLSFLGCSSIKRNETSAKIPIDSLIKYSYPIAGTSLPDLQSNIETVAGTGFFIRQSNGLFLITAKHILNGCGDNLEKNKFHPNFMNVLMAKKGILMPIDVSVIKDTASCLPLSDDPDIIVIKINDKWGAYINSVENHLYPPFEELNSTEMFGYSYIENKKFDFF